MTRTVVRPKGQITLPREVRDALHVQEGDDVAFLITDDGTVILTGLKTIPADQAWFWADEWQAGEREATTQAAAGEGTVYDTTDDFLRSLD